MRTRFAFFITVFMLFSLFSFSIQAKVGKGYDVNYEQTRADEFTLQFQLQDFEVIDVEKNGIMYSKIKFLGNLNTQKKGWAELPYLHAAVQLSPDKNVNVEIVNSHFVEIDLSNPMLPSRGTIFRNQDPNSIPYEIDPASQVDQWYPELPVEGSEPFIIRDVRGENIYVYAFQYNAVQNKLRIYTDITIRIIENSDEPINPIASVNNVINREMHDVYSSMFLNYNQNPYRWTNEIGEYGEMLVIYTSRDATVIQPWITWKKEKGVKVHELQVATGTNVKTNIASEYSNNNNILYVLLVGDWADIKSDLGTSQNAPMDPMMGCVVGADNYYDIMIGRFSASTTSHVTIQGDKVINYEKNPDLAGTWYSYGLGIGSSEGSGIGDDGEIDYDHIDIIKDEKLLPYNYTTVNEGYGTPTTTSVVNFINAGLGVINYCGHGAHDYWVTSNYAVTNVNSSTNGSKLPFVFSVACVVGEFHNGSDCLAEAMLKKSGGGAVATWMATINQPWTPPMRGQDYANDILTEGFNYSTGSGSGTSTTYGKNMYGAITFNAGALMIAESTATNDWDTYKTWTIFGDPNFQVRTETPKAITNTNPIVTPGTYTTQITVSGSPFANALVSLYQAGTGTDQPFAGLTDASGNVTITHPYTGTVKLTVTGYNLATYSADHVVAVADPPVCDFSADQTNITAGDFVNFSDLSTNYPSIWDWTLTGGTPVSSSIQNPIVQYTTPGVYSVTLYCENMAGNDSETKTNYITVNAIASEPVADFVASETDIYVGQSIDFTDLSTNLPYEWAWTFSGGFPGTSSVQNPTGITYNAVGTYAVTLVATNAFGPGTETKTAYINVLESGSFSMDFEACADYSQDLTPWLSVDGDGLDTYGSADCDFPGESGPLGFMAFNPADAGFTAIASTHGGDRCGIAICPADASAADDWIISEQLTMGTGSSISFWVLTAKDNWGLEDYHVLVSTTDNVTTSFTAVVGGANQEAPNTWTEVTYDLSAYDGQDIYVAVHYTSVDKFMLMMDDITINTTFGPSMPTAEFSASPTTICEGGSVSFTDLSYGADSYEWTFAGGTPSSSTNANPVITYSTAGTYTVTLTVTNTEGDDTEIKTNYITVGAAAGLVVNITTTDATCYGEADGTATANVTGGTGSYTYLWHNFATTATIVGLTNGLVAVTVTDGNGCEATDTETILQPAQFLLVGINPIHEDYPGACNGTATVNVSGGVAPYTYMWSDGQTTNPATGLCSGVYYVTVTDYNGCYVTGVVTITFLDDISETLNSSFSIYPNPTNGIVNVVVENFEVDQIRIMDVTGRTVRLVNIEESITSIDMRRLAKGLYFFELTSGKTISTVRVVFE